MERKGTFKVEFLKELEAKAQAKWEREKIFEEDAPSTPRKDPMDKYMVTFPFPYMNGRLHLGHTFTISKVTCHFKLFRDLVCVSGFFYKNIYI